MPQRKSPSGQVNSVLLEEVDSIGDARMLSHKPACIRIPGLGFYVLTPNVWDFENDSNPDNGGNILVVQNDESGDAYVRENLTTVNSTPVTGIATDESINVTTAGGVATLSTGDTSAAGAALLADAAIRRSAAVPFVTTRTTSASPAADTSTWTVANRFTWTAGQTDHLGGTTAKLMTPAGGAQAYQCRGDLTGITTGDEWTVEGYVKAGGTPWVLIQLSCGIVTFNLSTGKTLAGLAGSTETVDYRSSSVVAVGAGWYRIRITFVPQGAGAPYIYLGIGKTDTGANTFTPTAETLYTESWTCTRVNVASQRDLGSAGSTIAQGTAASSPCYDATGWDSVAAGAVRWTGANQSIGDSALPATLSGDAQPFSLAWVLDAWTVPTSDAYLMRATGSTASISVQLLTTGKLRVSRTNDAGTVVYCDTVDALKLVPQVLAVRYNGASLSVFSDGVSAPVTSHASSAGAATLTAALWGGQYLRALDAEAVVWDSALTDAQVLVASRAVGAAWGHDISEPWTVILAAGQSNMVAGKGALDDFSGRQRLHKARHYEAGSASTVGLEPYVQVVSSAVRANLVGVDRYMVDALQAMGRRKIIIIKYAVSGLGLFDLVPTWLGDVNPDYDLMIAAFTAGLAVSPANREVPILVFVGTETDAQSTTTASAVSANLQLLRSSIMTSLGLTDLEMSYNLLHSGVTGYTYTGTVRTQGIAAAAANTHLHYIDPSTYELGADLLHYTTAGAIQLGAGLAPIVAPFI